MPNRPDKPNLSEIVLYHTGDGRTRIEIRLHNEGVWLTQPLMRELFQTTKQNISHHIRNIYAEGKLVPKTTIKEFLTVRREGEGEVPDGNYLRKEL